MAPRSSYQNLDLNIDEFLSDEARASYTPPSEDIGLSLDEVLSDDARAAQQQPEPEPTPQPAAPPGGRTMQDPEAEIVTPPTVEGSPGERREAGAGFGGALLRGVPVIGPMAGIAENILGFTGYLKRESEEKPEGFIRQSLQAERGRRAEEKSKKQRLAEIEEQIKEIRKSLEPKPKGLDVRKSYEQTREMWSKRQQELSRTEKELITGEAGEAPVELTDEQKREQIRMLQDERKALLREEEYTPTEAVEAPAVDVMQQAPPADRRLEMPEAGVTPIEGREGFLGEVGKTVAKHVTGLTAAAGRWDRAFKAREAALQELEPGREAIARETGRDTQVKQELEAAKDYVKYAEDVMEELSPGWLRKAEAEDFVDYLQNVKPGFFSTPTASFLAGVADLSASISTGLALYSLDDEAYDEAMALTDEITEATDQDQYKNIISSTIRILPGMAAGTALNMVVPGAGGLMWTLEGAGSTARALEEAGVSRDMQRVFALPIGIGYAKVEDMQNKGVFSKETLNAIRTAMGKSIGTGRFARFVSGSIAGLAKRAEGAHHEAREEMFQEWLTGTIAPVLGKMSEGKKIKILEELKNAMVEGAAAYATAFPSMFLLGMGGAGVRAGVEKISDQAKAAGVKVVHKTLKGLGVLDKAQESAQKAVMSDAAQTIDIEAAQREAATERAEQERLRQEATPVAPTAPGEAPTAPGEAPAAPVGPDLTIEEVVSDDPETVAQIEALAAQEAEEGRKPPTLSKPATPSEAAAEEPRAPTEAPVQPTEKQGQLPTAESGIESLEVIDEEIFEIAPKSFEPPPITPGKAQGRVKIMEDIGAEVQPETLESVADELQEEDPELPRDKALRYASRSKRHGLTKLKSGPHFQSAMQKPVEEGKTRVNIFYDLDKFKPWNDETIEGHNAGDYIMKKGQRALAEAAEEVGINYYHIHGDEGAGIAELTDEEMAELPAKLQQMQQKLNSITVPITAKNGTVMRVPLGATIGVGADLAGADQAMLEGKSKRRNAIYIDNQLAERYNISGVEGEDLGPIYEQAGLVSARELEEKREPAKSQAEAEREFPKRVQPDKTLSKRRDQRPAVQKRDGEAGKATEAGQRRLTEEKAPPKKAPSVVTDQDKKVRLLDKAVTGLRKFGGRYAQAGAVPAKSETAYQKAIEALATDMGTTILWFKDGRGGLDINGYAPEDMPGVVLLNTEGDLPLLTTFLHEGLHRIQHDSKSDYNNLLFSLFEAMDAAGYREYLLERLANYGAEDLAELRVNDPDMTTYKGYPVSSYVIAELLADISGDIGTARGVFYTLADKAPKVLRKILRMVGDIIAAVKKAPKEHSRYLDPKGAIELRRQILEAMSKQRPGIAERVAKIAKQKPTLSKPRKATREQEIFESAGVIIGNPSQMRKLVQDLAGYAEAGKDFKNWYRSSSRAAMYLAGGDPVKAELYMNVAAVTSPQTSVAKNTDYVFDVIEFLGETSAMDVQDFERALAGRMFGKNRSVSNKVKQLIRGASAAEVATGPKVTPFDQTLISYLSSDFPGDYDAVMDTWIYRAFGVTPQRSQSATLQRRLQKEMRMLAKRLNLSNDQLQASIWCSFRQAWNDKYNDVIRSFAPGELTKIVRNGVEIDYDNDSWIKILKRMHERMEFPDPNTLELDDFARRIGERLSFFSYETIPTTSGEYAWMTKMAYEDKARLHRDLMQMVQTPRGTNAIFDMLELPLATQFTTAGAWELASNPSQQALALLGVTEGSKQIDKAVAAKLDAAANAFGYIYKQDAVAYHYPIYGGVDAANNNGIEVLTGRPFDEEQSLALQHSVMAAMPKYANSIGIIGHSSGARIINFTFGELSNADFHRAIAPVIDNAYPVEKVDTWRFNSDGGYFDNDWKENPDGSSYISRLVSEGRPDISGRGDDQYNEKVLGRLTESIVNRYGPQAEAIRQRYDADRRAGKIATLSKKVVVEDTKPFLTTSVFLRRELVGKDMVSRGQMDSLLKSKEVKPIEADVVSFVLDKYHKGEKKIDLEQLKREVNTELIPLTRISSTGGEYEVKYGVPELGYSGLAKGESIIFNAPYYHGQAGHWTDQYMELSKELFPEYEIVEGFKVQDWAPPSYAVVDKKNKEKVLGVFGSKEAAYTWIDEAEAAAEDTSDRVGLFGHLRVAPIGNAFNIMEIQSDLFQHYDVEAINEFVDWSEEEREEKPVGEGEPQKIIDAIDAEVGSMSEDDMIGLNEKETARRVLDSLDFRPHTGHFHDFYKTDWYKEIMHAGLYQAATESAPADLNYKYGVVQQLYQMVPKRFKTFPSILRTQTEAYHKLWPQRMVREAIKVAAVRGYETIRMPTEETLALVEGFVKKEADVRAQHELFAIGGSDQSSDEILKKAKPGATLEHRRSGRRDLILSVDKSGIDEGDQHFLVWTTSSRFADKYRQLSDQKKKQVADFVNNARYIMGVSENEPFPIQTFHVRFRTGDTPIGGGYDLTKIHKSAQEVLRNYKSGALKAFRRLRSDVTPVTDEQGNTWYESKITEADRNDPVLAFSKKVYHGSGSQYDDFDYRNNAGRASGISAMGAATYVTDVRGNAVWYAQELGGYRFTVDGMNRRWPMFDSIGVANMVRAWRRGEEIDEMAKGMTYPGDHPFRKEQLKELVDLIKENRVQVQSTSYLYTAELAIENGNFLDWNNPESQEMIDLGRQAVPDPEAYDSIISATKAQLGGFVTGGDIYRTVARILESNIAASDALAGVGIAGAFESDGPATTNYAVYDETLLGRPTRETLSKKKLPGSKQKDLYIVHNLAEESLERINSIGGIPAVSIAIASTKSPLKEFGGISLVFPQETVQPSIDFVYNGDAYTARRIMDVAYRPNRQVARATARKIEEAVKKFFPADDGIISRDSAEIMKEEDRDLFFDFAMGDVGLQSLFISETNERASGKLHYLMNGRYGEYRDWLGMLADELYGVGEMVLRGETVPATLQAHHEAMSRQDPRSAEMEGIEQKYGYLTGRSRERLSDWKSVISRYEAGGMEREPYTGVGLASLLHSKLMTDIEPYAQKSSATLHGLVARYYDENGRGNEDVRRIAQEIGFQGLPDNLVEHIVDMANLIREMPKHYFEVKMSRPVMIGEAKLAIVPDNRFPMVDRILRNAGVPFIEYSTAAGNREDAVAEAVKGAGLTFSKKRRGLSAVVKRIPVRPADLVASKYRIKEEYEYLQEARTRLRALQDEETLRMRAGSAMAIDKYLIAFREMTKAELAEKKAELREDIARTLSLYARQVGYPRDIYPLIKRVKTPYMFNKVLDLIDQRVQNNLRRMLYKKAKDRIKRYRSMIDAVKAGKRKSSVFTPEAAAELEALMDAFDDTRPRLNLDQIKSQVAQGNPITEAEAEFVRIYDKINGPEDVELTPEEKAFVIQNTSPRLDQMSAAQLRRVSEEMRLIYTTGRSERKRQVDREMKQVNAKRQAVVAGVRKVTSQAAIERRAARAFDDETRGLMKSLGEIGRFFGWQQVRPELLMEWATGNFQMLGQKPGALSRFVYEPIRQKAIEESIAAKAHQDKVAEIFKGLDLRRMYQKFDDFEVTVYDMDTGIPYQRKLSANQAMFVYANSQNEDNLRHLYGSGYTDDAVQTITDALPQEVKDAVDRLIDFYDTDVYPRVNEVFKKVYGVEMPKSDRYFPIMRLDRKRAESPVMIDLMQRYSTRPIGLDRKFTKGRVKSEAAFRDYDFFRTVFAHMRDVEHYIAFEETINTTRRILDYDPVSRAIQTRSEAAYKTMWRWHQDMIAGRPSNINSNALNTWADFIRRNYGVYALGLNVRVMAKQLASMTGAMPFVSPGLVTQRFAQYTTGGWKNMQKMVYGLSEYMKTRNGNVERTLRELQESREVKKAFGFGPAMTQLADASMAGIRAFDEAAVVSIWLAKFDDGMKKHGNQSRAVREADMLIRRTQPESSLVNLPEAFRDRGVVGAFTAFKNQINQNANMWAMIGMAAKSASAPPDEVMKMAVKMFFAQMAAAMWIYAIDTGAWYNPKRLLQDPEGLMMYAVNGVTGTLPVVGEGINSMMANARNRIREMRGQKPIRDYGFDVTPTAFEVFGTAGRFMGGVADLAQAQTPTERRKAAQKALKAGAQVSAIATRLPASMAIRAVEGAFRAAKGEGMANLLYPKSTLEDVSLKGAMTSRLKKPGSWRERLIFKNWYEQLPKDRRKAFKAEAFNAGIDDPSENVKQINEYFSGRLLEKPKELPASKLKFGYNALYSGGMQNQFARRREAAYKNLTPQEKANWSKHPSIVKVDEEWELYKKLWKKHREAVIKSKRGQ